MHIECRGKGKQTVNGMKIYTYTLEELIGPLNDVEERYAPKILYLAGDLPVPLPKPRVAIIGSRRASNEGIKAASYIASELVKEGVIIVSGLARGIDTAAHKSTIKAGGDTVAVLGTPLNRFYPKENYQLQELIMRNHLAISQFPFDYPIQPKNFVIRNRTMALISDASIIVEASDSSGSLHQGWEVLRLGRSLFIWKSLIEDDYLSWPEKMIEYGAMILTNPEEALDFLPTNERILPLIQYGN